MIVIIFACLFNCIIAWAEESESQPGKIFSVTPATEDFNHRIYFKGKREIVTEVGYLFYNTTAITDFIQGVDGASQNTLPYYTLAPITLALRYHLTDIMGPSFLRGNTDMTFGVNYIPFLRGPETYYGALVIGARYNFVQPFWKTTPFVETRGGAGFTDAQGPHGVYGAQGQDFAFNISVGSGFRYNFDPKNSLTLAITWYHISNMWLSNHNNGVENFGLNVIGPTIGYNYAF